MDPGSDLTAAVSLFIRILWHHCIHSGYNHDTQVDTQANTLMDDFKTQIKLMRMFLDWEDKQDNVTTQV